MSIFERALQVVKNLVVILTCVVILALVVEGYAALQRMQDSFQQIGTGL